MSIATLWAEFFESITTRPGQSLAAFLGDEAAWETLVELDLPVPDPDVFRKDRALDPNPFGLDLPQDMLENQFFVRCLAFWGWRPLLCSAVACARLQVQRPARLSCTTRALPDRSVRSGPGISCVAGRVCPGAGPAGSTGLLWLLRAVRGRPGQSAGNRGLAGTGSRMVCRRDRRAGCLPSRLGREGAARGEQYLGESLFGLAATGCRARRRIHLACRGARSDPHGSAAVVS